MRSGLDGGKALLAELLQAVAHVPDDVALEGGIAEGAHFAGEFNLQAIWTLDGGSDHEETRASRDVLEAVTALEAVGRDLRSGRGAFGSGRPDFDAGIQGVPVGEQ